jgi:hypothetical protein
MIATPAIVGKIASRLFMWQTSNGIRTLKGAEAALIRESIAHILDMLETEAQGLADHWEFGIPVFDKLSWQQQLVLLAKVGEALLRDDVPPLELTAINEATVGAIYENFLQCVQFEVDSDDPEIAEGCDVTYWRRLLHDAVGETDKPQLPPGPDEQLPNADCSDMEEWEIMIETIQSFVLWDADWLDEDLHLDVDPETSRLRKERLNIDETYYTAIPPDPNESEVQAARVRLCAIVTDSLGRS